MVKWANSSFQGPVSCFRVIAIWKGFHLTLSFHCFLITLCLIEMVRIKSPRILKTERNKIYPMTAIRVSYSFHSLKLCLVAWCIILIHCRLSWWLQEWNTAVGCEHLAKTPNECSTINKRWWLLFTEFLICAEDSGKHLMWMILFIILSNTLSGCCCSVTKSCPALCSPIDCSTALGVCWFMSLESVMLTISSSTALLFCLQSFPASGSFPICKWGNWHREVAAEGVGVGSDAAGMWTGAWTQELYSAPCF